MSRSSSADIPSATPAVEENPDSLMDVASLPVPTSGDDSLDQPSPAEKASQEAEKPADGQRVSEDMVVEQTHHLVVPSYAAWFDYHR